VQNTNYSTHSQQQQVEDLFHVNNGGSEDLALKTRGSLSKTQQINNLELGGISGDQPSKPKAGTQKANSLGSRRELTQNKPITGSQANRPGTAPQQLNVLLSSNSTSKPNRPMSPFTKVYTN
jgi:hypothetical protein